MLIKYGKYYVPFWGKSLFHKPCEAKLLLPNLGSKYKMTSSLLRGNISEYELEILIALLLCQEPGGLKNLPS